MDVAVDNLGVVPVAPAALAVETRDDAEQPVERVPVPGHLQTREVFAPAEEGGGIARVESTEPVVFTVVVPVSTGVTGVAVVQGVEPSEDDLRGAAVGGLPPAEAVTEVARFDLEISPGGAGRDDDG